MNYASRVSVLCLFLASCGDGLEPISPLVGPGGVPEVFSVVSGRTLAPVPSLVALPAPHGMVFQAPRFLSLVTGRSGKILLWPNDVELPLEYTRALAFPEGKSVRFGMFVRRVGLILPPEMRRPDVRTRVERVLEVVNSAQSTLRYRADDYSADALVSVRFNAKDPAFASSSLVSAVAHVSVSSSGVIRSATIVFPSSKYLEFEGWFETVLTHELGHTMGLYHSPAGSTGMMSANLLHATHDFTEQNKLVLRLLYAGIPGTELRGDTEYEMLSSSSSLHEEEVTIVCGSR